MRYPLAAPPLTDELKAALRRYESGLFEQAGVQALSVLQSSPGDHEALFLLRLVERRLARDAALPPATLIWQMNPDGAWETEWLRLLLRGAYTEEVLDNTWTRQARVMIVVDNRLVPEKLPYYREAFEAGCRIVLVHLSDEAFKDDYGIYRYCDAVIRNYHSSRLADLARVHVIPLGYKAGFTLNAQPPRPAAQRKYLWSFAGDAKKYTRTDMLRAMETLGSGHTHLTDGFGTADALPLEKYRALMDDTVVVPCPGGWSNLETFRVYEALEAGCIPIVERRPGFDYFTQLLGPHPIPSVMTWREGAALAAWLKDNDGLEALRDQCAQWWHMRKPQLAQTTAQFIAASFKSG
jgi:hypothetical protein